MRVTENLTIRPDKTFGVRFHDVSTLHATPIATAEKHLSGFMQQLLENQTFPEDVMERLGERNGQPGRDLTPWFTNYSKEVCQLGRTIAVTFDQQSYKNSSAV